MFFQAFQNIAHLLRWNSDLAAFEVLLRPFFTKSVASNTNHKLPGNCKREAARFPVPMQNAWNPSLLDTLNSCVRTLRFESKRDYLRLVWMTIKGYIYSKYMIDYLENITKE